MSHCSTAYRYAVQSTTDRCDIDRHFACRSLMAAYELASTGYQKVSILQGGFNEWERSGR